MIDIDISTITPGAAIRLRNGGIMVVDRVEDRPTCTVPCLKYFVFVNVGLPIAYSKNGRYHSSKDHPFDIVNIAGPP